MIVACGCHCGSTDNLIRNFLHRNGYPDWANIPIAKGRDKSLALLTTIPNYPEVEMLRNFLNNSSKWSVIIGYDDQGCKWSDIAHGGAKSQIEAELVLENYA